MKFAYREMLNPRTIRTVLITVGVIVGASAVVGPIDTYRTLAPLHRLAFCALSAGIGWPICYSISVMTLYFMRSRSSLATLLVLVLMTLTAAVPCTTFTYTVQELLRPYDSVHAGLLTIYLMTATVAVACSFLYFHLACRGVKHAGEAAAAATTPDAPSPDTAADQAAAAISPAAGDGHEVTPRATPAAPTIPDAPSPDTATDHQAAGERAPDRSPDPTHAPAAPGARAAPTRRAASTRETRDRRRRSRSPQSTANRNVQFFDRLPPEMGRDLIYLRMANHYVQVYTTAGTSLALIRFADAVAELGDLGMQVHRSYWVAHRHVTELVKREHRTILILTDDIEVPVSRTYLPAVRAAVRN